MAATAPQDQPTRCAAWVYTDSYSTPSKPCRNAGKHQHQGHLWCGVHIGQARKWGAASASLGRAEAR